MSFVKGVAVGLVAGMAAGVIVMPKPKKACGRMKKSADRAARSIGDLVDSIISVVV